MRHFPAHSNTQSFLCAGVKVLRTTVGEPLGPRRAGSALISSMVSTCTEARFAASFELTVGQRGSNAGREVVRFNGRLYDITRVDGFEG